MSHDSDQARTRELKRLKARVDELEEENRRLREAIDPEFLINTAEHIEPHSAAPELKELASLQKDVLYDSRGDASA